ncbi:hypothetical protein [Alkalibacterium olivapovliticus]|uniref:Uncharacterized protein n=1 Tax=Alkalibacterium olivapovliticus TaxID=99907 RepID=A0A2T0VY46_9LACT|nr:hypothetical protein [Alkalibacterium olivapovliticus]PRY77155.1 hypothetical protein CLV38_12926 [Alkalibacterium olivapovliticus]
MIFFALGGSILFLILASVFIYFVLATLVDKEVDAKKIMIIGVHISILGLYLGVAQIEVQAGFSLIVVLIGFILSLMSMSIDSR